MLLSTNPHRQGSFLLLHTQREVPTHKFRKFARGRTEVLRSCTPEMVEFVDAFCESHHTVFSCSLLLFTLTLLQRDSLRALFHRAARAHRAWGQAATNGQGVDRHILGTTRSEIKSLANLTLKDFK